MVLVFGDRSALEDRDRVEEILSAFPDASVALASTAGEIMGTTVRDGSVNVTAVRFDSVRVEGADVTVPAGGSSRRAGEELASRLSREGLAHVLVFSDGLHVNGTDLVHGLAASFGDGVTITGGLSADGDMFGRTVVGLDALPSERRVVALGLYGDRLRVGFGSLGGWDPFGPERHITRSEGNVLHELDGESALELYKRYLGEHADGLPGSALLFPLSVRTEDGETLVRTVLGVDEEQGTMTFAGDVVEGARARLMKANFDRLVDGASSAAHGSLTALGSQAVELAVLISCVGRKMVLRQRTEEEVEAVRDVLGDGAVLTGFYSYGELSPSGATTRCELHNQTMTITTLAEA